MPATPDFTLALALTALAAVAILTVAALKGFSIWIDLKRSELDTSHTVADAPPSMTSRIELADLKERLRKLEAIAAGVDP